MKLSIVVPTYNTGYLLNDIVKNIIECVSCDYEIIIIDGKDMNVFIFVYARDKKDKTRCEDGDIKYSILSHMRRFDGETVRNIINSEITKLEIGV